MFIKASLLAIMAFMQISLVLSQGFPGQQQNQFQGNKPGQMWNPSSWMTQYYNLAANSWSDYLKKAQEASNQFYNQWDKTTPADMMNMGLGFAQLASNQAKQAAQMYMQQPFPGMGSSMSQ